ncbi:Trehalose transport system permease protein SugA [Anaerolineae bacterium]|nr:Trehalose transport system permease protein SugA [Anaerolineae bacterium]
MRQGFLDRYIRWIFPAPALIFIVVMMIFPLGYTLWNSFTSWSLSTGKPATFIGIENYITLIQDERFQGALVRTIYFTGLALFVEMVLGIAIALLLNRDFKGKRIITSIMLLPMMATPVAIAMVWLLMYEPTAGIINFVLKQANLPLGLWIGGKDTVIPSLAIVDVWEWTPMIVLIALAGLTALPRDPFESAVVDGASYWQITWHITLPLLMPTITVAMLLRLIDALKTFDIIYTMTLGGPGFASETLNILTYQNAFYYNHFGYASSLLVVFFAIVLGISLLMTYVRRTVEV